MTAAKPAKAAKPRTGNKRAAGRAPKRPTFTVKVDGAAEATTPHRDLALTIARDYFASRKSVSVMDNASRKTVARFIYGHLQ